MKFATYVLDWPPQANHYYTVARNRKILSSDGRKYKNDMSLLLSAEKGFGEARVSVIIRAYPPDNRRRDLDNLLKPTLDALEAGGIFANDSQIDELAIVREKVKKDGELVVIVTEIEG